METRSPTIQRRGAGFVDVRAVLQNGGPFLALTLPASASFDSVSLVRNSSLLCSLRSRRGGARGASGELGTRGPHTDVGRGLVEVLPKIPKLLVLVIHVDADQVADGDH